MRNAKGMQIVKLEPIATDKLNVNCWFLDNNNYDDEMLILLYWFEFWFVYF